MKRTFFLMLLIHFCIYINAQVPQGFNYQAIARDASGNPLVSKPLQVKLTIKPDSSGAGIIWEETHASVTTTPMGMFTIILGKGERQAGSTVSKFSDIDWSVNPKFLMVDVYFNSTWKSMGITRLYSVPYAMVANDLGGTLDKLKVRDNGTNPMDSALFEVKNKNGQTVFAVYNEGVRVYVDDGIAKGVTKGGFAIGGFGTEKGTSKPLFVVNADSIRAYIAPGTVKGTKGGFAIGGFDNVKTVAGEEYLRVTRDSTRIYLNDTGVKGTKGGFAIGNFNAAKGSITNFTSLTPDNYFIGHQSGTKNSGGLYNSFLGFETGQNNVKGSNNVFLGYQSGYLNSDGNSNVFLGSKAGYNNIADNNVFLGFESGYMNTSGTTDAFMGYGAGRSNTTGSSNVFVGNLSGFSNTTGRSNVSVGNLAGYSGTNVNSNVFLGDSAGYGNIESYGVFIGKGTGKVNSGQYNTFIGFQAGARNSTGYDNIFIGFMTGTNNITGGWNAFLGTSAGYNNTEGSDNVFFGSTAGFSNKTGNYNVLIGDGAGRSQVSSYGNVFIGPDAGSSNTSAGSNTFIGGWAGYKNNGINNVMIGANSGYGNLNGYGNVFLGSTAGYSETGSDKLFIDSQFRSGELNARTSSLVYGEFNVNPANQIFTINANTYINGNVGIGTTAPNYTLDVRGTIGSNTTLYHSDIRWKTDIKPIKYGLDDIERLNSVSYSWNASGYPDMDFEQGIQLGFIAQEFEKVIPELVRTDKDGYKSIDYVKLTPVLVEAIKGQQKQIESVKKENQQLKEELEELKASVSSLIANQGAQRNKRTTKSSTTIRDSKLVLDCLTSK